MCPHNVKNILEMSKCAIIDVNMKFLVKHGKILTDINSQKKKNGKHHLGRDPSLLHSKSLPPPPELC